MNTIKINKFEVLALDKQELQSIRKEVFVDGIYNFSTQNENPYIIDIGSHIGLSVLFFKNLYPQSTITAFEPNPISFKILEQNIWMNNLKDVQLINKAVLNIDGETAFYIPESDKDTWHSNSSSLETSWNGKLKLKEIKVESTKLNSYIDKQVNLLKIDAEGAEMSILKSIADKLELIENIIIEYHPQSKSKLKKIINLLESNNFKVSFMQDSTSVTKLDWENLGIIIGRKK